MKPSQLSTVVQFMKLAWQRKKSEEHYFRFQQFQANLIMHTLNKHVMTKKPLTILEVGSHAGGYTATLQGDKKNTIITLDKEPHASTIKRYKKEKQQKSGKEKRRVCTNKCKILFSKKRLLAVQGDITSAPFKDEVFDVIIASSIIEHVRDQQKMIDECCRMLKEGGILYLSFPPYYSFKGGHYLSPFHYLPGSWPDKIYLFLHPKRKKPYDLYRTTICKIKGQVKQRFEIREISPRVFSFLTPIAKIPMLNEVLIHHIAFVARKRKRLK